MGRTKIDIDHNALLTLRSEGRTIEDISAELKISTATLSRRISYLRHNEGVLTKYRELQHLRISDLSAKVLDSLEVELPEMNVDQKIKLLGVLQRAESHSKEKEPEQITGLIGHLVAMQEEREKAKAITINENPYSQKNC